MKTTMTCAMMLAAGLSGVLGGNAWGMYCNKARHTCSENTITLQMEPRAVACYKAGRIPYYADGTAKSYKCVSQKEWDRQLAQNAKQIEAYEKAHGQPQDGALAKKSPAFRGLGEIGAGNGGW